MYLEGLGNFLLESATKGYASKDESSWIKEPDGSTTIRYPSGDWSMDDNFFGGEPFGGREVISFQGKPYWMMVYYGAVVPVIKYTEPIYQVLKIALAKPNLEIPVRGPRKTKVTIGGQGYRYELNLTGSLERFLGNERIYRGYHRVYRADIAGGLIDQR